MNDVEKDRNTETERSDVIDSARFAVPLCGPVTTMCDIDHSFYTQTRIATVSNLAFSSQREAGSNINIRKK